MLYTGSGACKMNYQPLAGLTDLLPEVWLAVPVLEALLLLLLLLLLLALLLLLLLLVLIMSLLGLLVMSLLVLLLPPLLVLVLLVMSWLVLPPRCWFSGVSRMLPEGGLGFPVKFCPLTWNCNIPGPSALSIWV